MGFQKHDITHNGTGQPLKQRSQACAHALQRGDGRKEREQNLRPHVAIIADWRFPSARSISARSLMTTEIDARLKKLRFRAWRRGFREADLILGPFADRHVSFMTPAELDTFEALLEVPDHDLYGWIVETAEAPPEFASELLNQIKEFRFHLNASGSDARGG